MNTLVINPNSKNEFTAYLTTVGEKEEKVVALELGPERVITIDNPADLRQLAAYLHNQADIMEDLKSNRFRF